MEPAGYLYKTVAGDAGVIPHTSVTDIYSVAGCISEDFADYIINWKHNGHWFFNSPEAMDDLAAALGVRLSEMKLFFYRVYPRQWNENSRTWEAFAINPEWPTDVVEPENPISEGFDVVSYSGQTSPECSPLSCNGLAQHVRVNSHCLFQTLEEAKQALESGVFRAGERGPYRILEVLSP